MTPAAQRAMSARSLRPTYLSARPAARRGIPNADVQDRKLIDGPRCRRRWFARTRRLYGITNADRVISGDLPAAIARPAAALPSTKASSFSLTMRPASIDATASHRAERTRRVAITCCASKPKRHAETHAVRIEYIVSPHMSIHKRPALLKVSKAPRARACAGTPCGSAL